ncbi:hypothetical protein NC653_034407 [Populus alba x Populus x berolinensis]|uniref:Uncharacterized protein n=1 Tax=Populus alba x Populus x berolinensis TaxID=444605 RepID=A0AAD6LMG4_9ROSI|nr:hypothetical protein NC653_034407 [Populus alba x Populus x berolinensis]
MAEQAPQSRDCGCGNPVAVGERKKMLSFAAIVEDLKMASEEVVNDQNNGDTN